MKKILLLFLLFFIIPSSIYALNEPQTGSPYIALMDLDTGRVLYNKNMYDKCYPASTTKVMTAILVLENCSPTETCIASYNAVNSVPLGGSNCAIKVGETFSVSDLMLAMMVASGNEAANILSEYVETKTGRYFSDLMNDKAKQLGCVNTHFSNSNGLHNDDHYSCAYDMALIYRYAWKNYDSFQTYVSTLKFSLPTTDKYTEDDRVFTNTNKLLIPSTSNSAQNYFYEYATGGKTGYTNQAKNCLISSASKSGFNLVCSVMGSEQDSAGNSWRYIDTKALFDYGFSDLVKATIATKGDSAITLPVSNAVDDQKNLNLVYSESLIINLSLAESLNTFVPEITLISGDLVAPIKKGDLIGKANFNIYNVDYSIDLLADSDIQEKPKILAMVVTIVLNILKVILIIFVILLIVALAIRTFNMIRRKKRKKQRMQQIRYNARFRR